MGDSLNILLPNCYKWCKDALYTHVSGLFVNRVFQHPEFTSFELMPNP